MSGIMDDPNFEGDEVGGESLAGQPTTIATTQVAPCPPDSSRAHFLNVGYGVIGRTVSTKFEPNTSSQFQFWLGDRAKVQNALGASNGVIEIGNIVAAHCEADNELTFGTVVEMRSFSDVDSFIADYLSHNFGDAGVELPTDVAEVVVVTCNVTRNLSGKTRPVGSARVYFPSEQGIRFSFGIVNAEGTSLFAGNGIPIGLFENGDGTVAAVHVDEHFLTGPEGAHLNVSGISGLASKTSAVEFILKSLLAHTSKRLAVVMFNVKSRDLLYIDQPNPRVAEDAWSAAAYEHLGISTEPFKAAFFAPQDPSDPDKTQSGRVLTTRWFSWDLSQMVSDIPSLFDPDDWDDKLEAAWYRVVDEIERGNEIITYQQMLSWLDKTIRDALAKNNSYPLGVHTFTWQKLRSRLRAFQRRFPGLIQTAGKGKDIPWQKLRQGFVWVIDIEMLSDQGKKLVFGRAMRELSDGLENAELELDGIVVFVDELNKFAPAGATRSPLKTRLVDITARGRSIGLVLFGAEQFASSVEREIVENSATYLFGRTEANELRTPNYAGFSDEVKAKLMMLGQGRLLAKSAKYAQPVFLRFPYPPCLPGDQYGKNESPEEGAPQ